MFDKEFQDRVGRSIWSWSILEKIEVTISNEGNLEIAVQRDGAMKVTSKRHCVFLILCLRIFIMKILREKKSRVFL